MTSRLVLAVLVTVAVVGVSALGCAGQAGSGEPVREEAEPAAARQTGGEQEQVGQLPAAGRAELWQVSRPGRSQRCRVFEEFLCGGRLAPAAEGEAGPFFLLQPTGTGSECPELRVAVFRPGDEVDRFTWLGVARDAESVRWSGEGRSLLFVRGDGLWRVSLEGTLENLVAARDLFAALPAGETGEFALLQQGEGGLDLVILGPEGKERLRAKGIAVPPESDIAAAVSVCARWRPRHDEVAVLSRGDSLLAELVIVNGKSGATRSVPVPGAHSLEWSSDGSRLAVFPGSVRLADGSKVSDLPEGIYGGVWSPDGAMILCSLGFIDVASGACHPFVLPEEARGARIAPLGWADGAAWVLLSWSETGEGRR